ncbi:MAG TPA: hypothetical protein VFE48_22380 [Methylomirabilota bacterium]|nr:hypothetical protein [Methylomirabilota bacterium]
MREELVAEEYVDDPEQPGKKKLAYRTFVYHYTTDEIAIMKSRQALQEATIVASQVMQAALASPIAKSAEGAANVGELAKVLVNRIAIAATRPLVKYGYLDKNVEWEAARQARARQEKGTEVAPGLSGDADPSRPKKAKNPVGADPDEPHLDEDRALASSKKRPRAPAVVSDAPSKSVSKVLKAAGFADVGVDDQGLMHLVNDETKSEALIHESGEWAIRSGWDGQVVTGETADDAVEYLQDQ